MAANEERLRGLLVRGLGGDAVAYHAFLKDLGAHLRAFLRRRLGHLPDEVEDLVQESLLAVHNQRHTYNASQPLTAWVHAIAKYKLVDLMRRRQSRELLTEPLDDENDVFSSADADAAEARRDIGKLLLQLPDRQRVPIVCMKLEGRSAAETARFRKPLAGLSCERDFERSIGGLVLRPQHDTDSSYNRLSKNDLRSARGRRCFNTTSPLARPA